MAENPVRSSNLPLEELSTDTLLQSLTESENEEEVETDDQEMTNDEYYIEHLRKENLLRTMKELDEKQIFLFEVFINCIEITKENELLLSAGEFEPLPPIRVRVKFANMPCFDIFEEEMPAAMIDKQDVANMSGKVIGLSKSSHSNTSSQHGQWTSTFGKSCLFFMIPMELIHCIQSTPVQFSVNRTPDNDYDCPTSFVGHASFLLEEDFVDCVLHAGNVKTELPINAYQSRSCTIHNLAKEETGKLNTFIRLSCFGNMISTQFQLSKDGKEYVFKHSPGEPQISTTEVQLPDDYIPPKSLGKTDLLPLHPLVASEKHLTGLGVGSDKDLIDTDTTGVVWRHCKKGVFEDPLQHPTKDEIESVGRSSHNSNESPFSDEKFSCHDCSCNQIKTKKPFYCKRFEKMLSKYETEAKIYLTDLNEDKCLCQDCICNSIKKTKEIYSGKHEKVLPKQKTKRESIMSVTSKEISNHSLKKRMGSGDFNEASQVKKMSMEKTSTDKNETKPTKAIKELKEPALPIEKGSVGKIKTDVTFDTEHTKQKKNKVFTWDLKKPTKKKEQLIESNHRLSSKRPQFDYHRREYPGMNIGHKHCTEAVTLVPENMGWLWNIEDKSLGLKVRKGWRPGAIGKSVTYQKINSKKPQTAVTPGNVFSTSNMQKTQRGWARHKIVDKKESFSELVDQPPTFRLQQTRGKYFLSMIPIKEEDEEQKPVEIQVLPEEPDESTSESRTSDTSIEVVFTCPGALRRKVVKPAYTEANTQYLEDDTKILQPRKSITKPNTPKNKKQLKIIPPMSANSEPKNNLWEEQQTQMSLQKKKK